MFEKPVTFARPFREMAIVREDISPHDLLGVSWCDSLCRLALWAGVPSRVTRFRPSL